MPIFSNRARLCSERDVHQILAGHISGIQPVNCTRPLFGMENRLPRSSRKIVKRSSNPPVDKNITEVGRNLSVLTYESDVCRPSLQLLFVSERRLWNTGTPFDEDAARISGGV
jgi:hypothetical protein